MSKEYLEVLDWLLANEMVYRGRTRLPISPMLREIKQVLLKQQKQLKALEIIKEKRIDIEIFYTSFIEGNRNYSFYDIHYGTYGEYCLTEDEFNLLREVLDNGAN